MKVIITGTTGMVGEGVLMECLANPQVQEVLSVSRRPAGKSHPKLKELIVPDFSSLQPGDERFRDYDACFFCAGVSSIGMKEAEYSRLTYDTTMAFAQAVAPNPNLTFVYVSGGGTDSTEKGRLMWARVKGKTENDLRRLPFKRAFAFRPGFMKAIEGQQYVLSYYKYFAWMFPLLKVFAPRLVNTLQQVGQAMIYAAQQGYEKDVIEVSDITILSNRAQKSGGQR